MLVRRSELEGYAHTRRIEDVAARRGDPSRRTGNAPARRVLPAAVTATLEPCLELVARLLAQDPGERLSSAALALEWLA